MEEILSSQPRVQINVVHPVVVIPPSHTSSQALCLDLGDIAVSNILSRVRPAAGSLLGGVVVTESMQDNVCLLDTFSVKSRSLQLSLWDEEVEEAMYSNQVELSLSWCFAYPSWSLNGATAVSSCPLSLALVRADVSAECDISNISLALTHADYVFVWNVFEGNLSTSVKASKVSPPSQRSISSSPAPISTSSFSFRLALAEVEFNCIYADVASFVNVWRATTAVSDSESALVPRDVYASAATAAPLPNPTKATRLSNLAPSAIDVRAVRASSACYRAAPRIPFASWRMQTLHATLIVSSSESALDFSMRSIRLLDLRSEREALGSVPTNVAEPLPSHSHTQPQSRDAVASVSIPHAPVGGPAWQLESSDESPSTRRRFMVAPFRNAIAPLAEILATPPDDDVKVRALLRLLYQWRVSVFTCVCVLL